MIKWSCPSQELSGISAHTIHFVVRFFKTTFFSEYCLTETKTENSYSTYINWYSYFTERFEGLTLKPPSISEQQQHSRSSSKTITFYMVCVMENQTRIFHRSLMQTEKSQPEGKRIMPETRFTVFPALSVDSRVGISRSALETDV